MSQPNPLYRLCIAGVCVASLLGSSRGGLIAAERAPNAKSNSPPQTSKRAELGSTDPRAVARLVDEIIEQDLTQQKLKPAPVVNDEEFIRRLSLDLVGKLPTSNEVTLFCLDSDPAKRSKLIDSLIKSSDFSRNWSMYWREVLFSRATEQRARIQQGDFENWMEEQFEKRRPWDAIVTELLTATGDIEENANTTLMFIHSAEPEEIAAESCRIFLGIQIQCANCHDHPSDRWKREQFHELAAFFPRVTMRPKRDAGPRSFEISSLSPEMATRGPARLRELLKNPEELLARADRNHDKHLSLDEFTPRRPRKAGNKGNNETEPATGVLSKRLMEQGDKDKDGKLSLKELKEFPIPAERPGAGSIEHYMPDLKHPQDKGKKMDPVFFLDNQRPGSELSDLERRKTLASYMTSPKNPWFARAFVNRAWCELLGRGFYMPVDDMGPDRTPQHGDALDLLSQGFIKTGYDIRWVYHTITESQTYQRAMNKAPSADDSTNFAAITPTRIRSDALFDALVGVLGVPAEQRVPKTAKGAVRFQDRTLRGQFNLLFGYDPSTPQDEILGTVPQALFLMNNPTVAAHLSATRSPYLSRVLHDYPKDDAAVKELYLHVLSREPHDKELKVAMSYIQEVGDRSEAYEDLYWSLLNSAEFLTKR